MSHTMQNMFFEQRLHADRINSVCSLFLELYDAELTGFTLISHLDAAGQYVLGTPDRLAKCFVLLARSKVEGLSPPILIKVGDQIVETGTGDMEASTAWSSEGSSSKCVIKSHAPNHLLYTFPSPIIRSTKSLYGVEDTKALR